MPIFEYTDALTGERFHEETRDMPPELDGIGYLMPPGTCDCYTCQVEGRRFTPEQRDLYREIRTEAEEAQARLDAFIAACNAGRRCVRCASQYGISVRHIGTDDRTPVAVCRYCVSALFRCPGCETVQWDHVWLHSTTMFERGRLCSGCASTYAQCWCGYWYDPEVDDPCRERPGTIHSYGYRPRPVFHQLGDGTDLVLAKGAVDRTPYMGFELEVSFADGNRYDAASRVTDLISGIAYLKEDGSIDDGFELVTHPMTYAYARERFPWEVLDEMSEEAGTVHSGLGLHVHVSKAAFDSPAHEYRWLLFWYRNAEIMKRLARRTSNEWAAFSPSARKNAKRIAKKESQGREDGRYVAINPTNPDTYEVRIFRSTLSQQKLLAALALVSGSVEYTRRLDSAGVLRASGWEFDTFATWTAKRPEYAPLTGEITRLFPHGTADFVRSK